MKCGCCHEVGHNRTTCPKNPPHPALCRLPQSPPVELMRMLISPSQALDLAIDGKTADALANATRQIAGLARDGVRHLVCSDILTALAELDLRAKQIAPEVLGRVEESCRAIEEARDALTAAEAQHVRAKAEVFLALGYRAHAEAMMGTPR